MNKCFVKLVSPRGRVLQTWEQLFEDEESARQYALAWLGLYYEPGDGYCLMVDGIDISFECVI